MATMGRAIGLAKYDVGMEFWISIIKNNVPYEGKNLPLLLNGDLVIRLLRPVEVSQGYIGKGSNCGEVATLNLILSCKGEQTFYHFVAFV